MIKVSNCIRLGYLTYMSLFLTWNLLQIKSGLVSSFLYHSGIYSEDSEFFDIDRVWVSDGEFFSQYHSCLYTMQKPSYLRNIGVASMWVRMVLTQISTWEYKYSHILTYTHQISIFDWYWNFDNPWGGSLIPTGRFYDIIIYVGYSYHAFPISCLIWH